MTDFSSVLNKIRTSRSDFAAFHAFLLEGATLSNAVDLARAFLCKRDDCGICSVCNKISGNVHVDVKVYNGADDKGLNVDVIRQISEDLYIKPNESAHKIYVLQNADLMNIQAANALLKSLEEPPNYGVFVLTASSRFKLPETIRSRCALISLHGDSQAKNQAHPIATEIVNHIQNHDEFKLFAALSLIKNRDEMLAIINNLREIFAQNIRQNNLNISANITTALFGALETAEDYLKSNMQIRLLAAIISTQIFKELRS